MSLTINIILLCFAIVSAMAALKVKELISAVLLLGAFSFFMAILWTDLGAPDVSFTEAMVGVGASTIFLILGIFQTNHLVRQNKTGRRPLTPLLSIILLGALLFWASQDLPALGNALSPANAYLSPYYLSRTYHDAHTPNAVTAIVVDYRGFDTLIETAVIFTAGIACLLIMKEKV